MSRFTSILLVVPVALICLPFSASAETTRAARPISSTIATARPSIVPRTLPPLRPGHTPPKPAAFTRGPNRPVGRRIAGAAVGAAGGFFAGGFTGHAIERKFFPCGCDDPGLRGFLIGAPLGAIAGGVSGALWF